MKMFLVMYFIYRKIRANQHMFKLSVILMLFERFIITCYKSLSNIFPILLNLVLDRFSENQAIK